MFCIFLLQKTMGRPVCLANRFNLYPTPVLPLCLENTHNMELGSFSFFREKIPGTLGDISENLWFLETVALCCLESENIPSRYLVQHLETGGHLKALTQKAEWMPVAKWRHEKWIVFFSPEERSILLELENTCKFTKLLFIREIKASSSPELLIRHLLPFAQIYVSAVKSYLF